MAIIFKILAKILKIMAKICFNVNFLKTQVVRFEETKELEKEGVDATSDSCR